MDGHSLSYDGSGNPLSYYNGKSYTMTWNEGRQLASLTTGGKTTTYTYDLNGLRTKKVNPDGTWVKYFIGDGKILGETLHTADNHEVYDMRYTFDENGEVCGISLWNQGDTAWTKYYFVKNLQGDVLAVYQYGSSFTKVAEYTYDSWGNVLTATGALANINPFRYRSYYQDAETGFYYLQSRYYDPAIGRFINADSFASTGQDFIGCNMFAYCGNNPINASDATGMLFLFDDAVLLAACFVVAVVAVVVVVYSPPVREAIYGMADALADVLLDVFKSIEQAAENIIEEFKEHTKGARNSTRGKHEEGNARRNRDAQGEKGDARRQSRSNKKVKTSSLKWRR